ncbi:MAG: LPP20 family lipoprotein [Elusimicrobia bacterium]|nr:LPP20 family lipoprotein [Elusimicrobiota bacterium]
MKSIALAAMSLAAAASLWAGEPKKEWADGSSIEFPNEKYIIGVGVADSRAAAEDRARAEIAKIFSAQVTVSDASSALEASRQEGAKKESSFSQAVSQSVQTTSRKILEDAPIKDHWQDPATREQYALAVLDRGKGMLAVQEKISDFDRQIAQWKAEMEKAQEKFTLVKSAMKLMALLKARADVNSELRILDPEGKTIPSPVDEATLRIQAGKALAELEVMVDVGEGSNRVETGIIQGLNKAGLQARAGAAGAPADIAVEGRFETKPVEGGDPRWKWARSTGSFKLKDKAGKIFLAFEVTDRQASADYSEALRRVQVELAKKASSQVSSAVTEYFENQ